MERVIRINPFEDFHKIHDMLTRDDYKEYANDISYESLEKCRQYSWMVVNHYNYILAILCARLIRFEDSDIEIKYRLNSEKYLYKIEILDRFLDLQDTEMQYNDIRKVNEYHILFSLINEAMKTMCDLVSTVRIETRFCSKYMQNALKNNRFELVKMNTKYMDFVRY